MQWDLWTSLQAGTPASHSVRPGSDEARTMTVTSGRNLLGLYKSTGRVGPLARMLLVTSRWASTTCLLTWKDSATPGKRLLFQLAASTRNIGANEFGLWRTPRANDWKGGLTFKTSTLAMSDLFLPDQVNAVNLGLLKPRMPFATPTASIAKGGAPQDSKGKRDLRLDVGGGNLNPTWVEWLMGYPTGWTDLGRSVMQSSRKSRKKSSGQ